MEDFGYLSVYPADNTKAAPRKIHQNTTCTEDCYKLKNATNSSFEHMLNSQGNQKQGRKHTSQAKHDGGSMLFNDHSS